MVVEEEKEILSVAVKVVMRRLKNRDETVYEITMSDGDKKIPIKQCGKEYFSTSTPKQIKKFINTYTETIIDNNTDRFYDSMSDIIGHKVQPKAQGTRNERQIKQLDSDGNIIRIYNSIKEVSKYGFTPSCVGDVARGKLKKHKGFIFEYYS